MSDKTLCEQIGVEPTRGEVVGECTSLVDREVKAKSGMSGIAIKGAYGTVKKIKPGFVNSAVDGLLDGWLEKLEPYYAEWRGKGAGSFADHVSARSEDVAEALLEVTDERAETSKHRTAAKLYKKLRPSAKRNVVEAVPNLGVLIERHLGSGNA